MAQEPKQEGHSLTDQHNPYTDIERDIAAEIGFVSVYWSVLEFTIFAVLLDLIDLSPDIGACVFQETSFLHKTNSIGALIDRSGNGEWIQEWKELERYIDQLRTSRNDLIHGLWSVTPESIHALLRVRVRRKLIRTNTLYTASDIQNLRDNIIATVDRVYDFYSKLKFNDITRLISQDQTSRKQSPSQSALAQYQARARKRAAAQSSRDLARMRKSSQDGGS